MCALNNTFSHPIPWSNNLKIMCELNVTLGSLKWFLFLSGLPFLTDMTPNMMSSELKKKKKVRIIEAIAVDI